MILFYLFLSKSLLLTKLVSACWPIDCKVASWSQWSQCSLSCGIGGVKLRSKYVMSPPRCAGKGCPDLVETTNCNSKCCPANCICVSTRWSSCHGCDKDGRRARFNYVAREAECGGSCSISFFETQKCSTVRCCPVDCTVGLWGSWSACNAACDKTGTQTRSRSITTQKSCNGKACPPLTHNRICNGKCCPKNCQLSGWSSWGSCVSPTGSCSQNSGSKSRTRTISKQATCGGTCASTKETQKCTPPSISCQVSSWSAWTPCKPNNGKCGPGSQTRARTILKNPKCSPACPTLRETRKCSHSCCPVDCRYSSWGAWSQCSSQCGKGTQKRTRSIQVQGSCNGKRCQQTALTEQRTCTKYINVDCKMTSWSSWSDCNTKCGTGVRQRTRVISQQSKCNGKKCGKLLEQKTCTSYAARKDCEVTSWSQWGLCDSKCSIGSKRRIRLVKTRPVCNGKQCPKLEEFQRCGQVNGGCSQLCSNGTCSCKPGFNLKGNSTCEKKDCGLLLLSYCPPAKDLPSEYCVFPFVKCPGGDTKYPVICKLSCRAGYTMEGSDMVSCQNTGSWSPSQTYCKRINKPPSDILLLSNYGVPENKGFNTLAGTIKTVDDNKNDTHTYSLVKDTCGGFSLIGNELRTSRIFDYELQPSCKVTIKSQDDGIPPLSLQKEFDIVIMDVNESPTKILLSNNLIDENSDANTVIGELTTFDPDLGQTHTFQLMDYSDHVFKIKGNKLLVSKSTRECMRKSDPSICPLNYEKDPVHKVTIFAVDNGSPSQSYAHQFDIKLRDINDAPYDIKISSTNVNESTPANILVAYVTAKDEDKNQNLSYRIYKNANDNGNFKLTSDGRLFTAKRITYENNTNHKIEVEVYDNGFPVKKKYSSPVGNYIFKVNNRSTRTRSEICSSVPCSSVSIVNSEQSREWFNIFVVDINEQPHNTTILPTPGITKTQNGSLIVPENVTIYFPVATITTAYNISITNIIFHLSHSKFDVSGTNQSFVNGISIFKARLFIKDTLDFEYENYFALKLVIKNGIHANIHELEIFISDSNDAPTDILINNGRKEDIYENIPGANIGFLSTVDQDKHDSFAYETSHSDVFTVVGNLLMLQSNVSLNYEEFALYVLIINSTDNGIPPMRVQSKIEIHVLNDNDKPYKVTLDTHKVKENFDNVSIGINVFDQDIARTSYLTHPCKIENSTYFFVEKNIVKVRKVLNYEEDQLVNLTILCNDKQLISAWSFQIEVIDENEAPTKIVFSKTSINENQKPPYFIANLSTFDPDFGQSHYYEIMSNQDLFKVMGNQLFGLKSFDFETQSSIDIEIKTTDIAITPLSRTQTEILIIIDQNDKPDFTLNGNNVDENSPEFTEIGTLSYVDDDILQSSTFELIESSDGRFEINGSTLMVSSKWSSECSKFGGPFCTLNFEKNRVLDIRISCTDNGIPTQTTIKDFKIYLNDVNDVPFNLTLSNSTINENAPIGVKVGQFSGMDEDVSQTLTFSLVNNSSYFYIDTMNNLRKKGNFSTTKYLYKVLVKAEDNGSPSMEKTEEFSIEVIDVNEAPIDTKFIDEKGQHKFNENSPVVDENSYVGRIIGTLYTYDKDYSQSLNITLDDDDNGSFKLDKNISCTQNNQSLIKTTCKCLLLTNGKLDHEVKAKRTISVRTTDHGGLHYIKVFVIKIVDVNEKPLKILLGGKLSTSILEHASARYIGDLSTVDEDFNQFFSYELMSHKENFEIKQNKFYRKENFTADYEINFLYNVTIKTTDSGKPNLSYTQNVTIYIINQNEKPSQIFISKGRIYENQPVGTFIGNITVDDPDNSGLSPNQTFDCEVGGQHASMFKVKDFWSDVNTQTKIHLLSNGVLDFEKTSYVAITLKCTDSGSPRQYLEKDFIMQIIDVNEKPKNITITTNEFLEETNPQTVGILTTDDPDNYGRTGYQTFNYTLLNATDDVPFKIVNDELRTTELLDYEFQDLYELHIKSVDSGNTSLAVISKLKIYVKDINESPTDIMLSNVTLKENSGKGVIIGKLKTIDPDNKNSKRQQFTYTFTSNPQGMFRIENDQLQVAIGGKKCQQYGGKYCKFNFEENRSIKIGIKVTDNGIPPNDFAKSFTIQILNQNDPPRNLRLTSNIVPENASIGYIIGQFLVDDEDDRQNHSFTLVSSDNQRFTLDRDNNLRKAKPTNYESNKSHQIFVQVEDNGYPTLKASKGFDIFVQDVNESPTNLYITDEDGVSNFPMNKPTIPENWMKDSIIGTVEAMDQDTVTDLKFEILNDLDSMFKLGSPVTCTNQSFFNGTKVTKCKLHLISNERFNYEKQSKYQIAIKVKDHDNLSHIQTFDVNILNENDPPSNVTVKGEMFCLVQENLRYREIGHLEVIDEDLNQEFQYKLVDDAGGRFIIQSDMFGINKLFTTDIPLDYEHVSTYNISIKATDNGNPPSSVTSTITVQVIDVNEPATDILLNNPYVKENSIPGIFVSNLTVKDPDANQLHFCELEHSTSFKLVNNQLFVKMGNIDFETNNQQKIRIECKDSGYPPSHYEKELIVNIEDVNEAPVGISLTGGAIPENIANYLIGKLTVTDPDIHDNHTYFLKEENPYFKITGQELRNNLTFNYEKKALYHVNVSVKDKGDLEYIQSFVINVENRNDPPSDIICSGMFSLPEDAKPGTAVGRCEAIDEEIYQYHQYSLTDVFAVTYNHKKVWLPPQTIFAMDSSSGKIELGNTKLDYETVRLYILTIKATDNGSPVYNISQNVTVYITNVNQPPTDIVLSNEKVMENSKLDTVVANITVVDPDNVYKNNQSHSCWIANLNSSVCPFMVNELDQVIVKNPNMLDYETSQYFQVKIICNEDQDIYSIEKNFTIQVVDINEAPTSIYVYPSTIDEHSQLNKTLALIVYQDPDKRVKFRDVAVTSFKSFDNTFKLQQPFDIIATKELDFEVQDSHLVEIKVSDTSHPSISLTVNFTIKVGNLNDAPTKIELNQTTIKESELPGSTVAILSSVDADQQQTHTYKLIDDGGVFQISNNQLILSQSLDYETEPIVIIQVESTDNGMPPLSVQEVFNITVLDENDKPTAIQATIIPIPENTQVDYKLAELKVIDEDKSQNHSCICISSNKDWVHLVKENNGNISVYLTKNQIIVNYEVINEIKLEIQCSDNGEPALSTKTSLSVPVIDINESPLGIFVGDHKIITLNENPIPDQIIGKLRCSDPDNWQSHTYQLNGDSKIYFKVLPSSNELAVNHLTNFNYEAPPGVHNISVNISVTDNGVPPKTFTDTLVVISENVNEPPINITLIHGSNTIPETKLVNEYIGELWADDPEGDTQTFELLNYKETFKVATTLKPSATSFLQLIKELNHDDISSYVLSVKATDSGKPPLSTLSTIIINVSRINPCIEKLITCQNYSKCERENKTYGYCKCLTGYELSSNTCVEIDECKPKCEFCIGNRIKSCKQVQSEPCSPCQNGGKCSDKIGDYSCKCEPGFKGHDCSVNIDDCYPKPCLHSSTCEDGINNYTCICQSGYNGSNCEQEINECSSKPCFKGDCKDLVNAYKCMCPPGYYGINCERREDACKISKCDSESICVAADLSIFKNSVESIRSHCVPNDRIVGLNFPQSFAKLDDEAALVWKYQFTFFLRKSLKIPLPWIQVSSSQGFKEVFLTDAMIIKYDGSLLYKNELETRVEFFGKYKDKVLSPNVLLYSMNETCEELYNDCSAITHEFQCKTCKVVSKHLLNSQEIKKPVILESQVMDDDSTLSYALVATLSFLGLITLIAAIYMLRRRRKSYKPNRESSKTDMVNQGTDLAILARRSTLTSGNFKTGFESINPLYVLNENEEPTIQVTDSALFENCVPDDIFADKTKTEPGLMFSNPAFGLIQENRGVEESVLNDVDLTEDPGIVNPIYEEMYEK